MTNPIAVYSGPVVLYWSAIIISIGLLAALFMSLSLQLANSGRLVSMLLFFPLAIVFSVPLCRPSSAPQINSPRRINSTNGVPLVLRELSDVLPERCFSPKDL